MIASTVGQGVAGQMYLQNRMLEYLKIYPDESFVHFVDWFLKLQENKSYVKRNYLESLQEKLYGIMTGLQNIFSVYRGIDDKVWVEENLVIEIPKASDFLTKIISIL